MPTCHHENQINNSQTSRNRTVHRENKYRRKRNSNTHKNKPCRVIALVLFVDSFLSIPHRETRHVHHPSLSFLLVHSALFLLGKFLYSVRTKQTNYNLFLASRLQHITTKVVILQVMHKVAFSSLAAVGKGFFR